MNISNHLMNKTYVVVEKSTTTFINLWEVTNENERSKRDQTHTC
jgi:hypothetical protein